MLPPTVRLRAGVVGINQDLLISSLISVVSEDAPVTLFEIQDNGSGAGFFELDGVRQASGSFFRVTPAQLPNLIYRGASRRIGETFTVRATSVFGVSAERTTGISTGNSRPVITTSNDRIRVGEEVAIATLLDYFDADGDAPRNYGFVDRSLGTSGQLFLDGVAQAQATFFFVPASELSRVTYRGGSVGGRVERLGVLVSDGVSFSDLSEFTIRTQGAPIVTADRTTPVQPGERVAAADLFNVSDPDGDEIVSYFIVDRSNRASSGHFELNGQRQPEARFIRVLADELDQLVYVAGDGTLRTENIGVVAFDGTEFSDVVDLPVSFPPTTTVVVTGTDTTLDEGQAISIESLINISGTGGEPVSRYFLVDRSFGNGGGFFEVDGVRVDSARFFRVDGDQIDSVVYRGGTINETENIGVQVRVGTRLSQIVDFQITTQNDDPVVEPPPTPPELDVLNITGRIGTVFDLNELFRTSDEFTTFGLIDSDADPDSGFFAVDGVRQNADVLLEFDASAIDSITYQLGSTVGTEEFGILISDGEVNSLTEVGTVTTFFNAEIEAVDNAIQLDTLEQVALSDVFQQINVVPGREFTTYQVFDENDALADGPLTIEDRSARLVRNGVNLERGVVLEFTAAEFDEIAIQGAEVDFGRSLDPILVRGAGSDGVFSEFERVNVTTDPVATLAISVPDGIDEDSGEGRFVSLPSVLDVPAEPEFETIIIPPIPAVPNATGQAGQSVFTYTFIDGNGNITPSYFGDDDVDGVTPLSQPQREAVRQVFETIETYINVQFIEQQYELTAAASQIVIGADLLPTRSFGPPTFDDQNPQPVEGGEDDLVNFDGFLIDNEDDQNLVDRNGDRLVADFALGNPRGDIFFNSTEFTPGFGGDVGLGTRFFTAALEETLQVLGLVPPSSGTPTLSIFNDFTYNTILSGTDAATSPFNPLPDVHPETNTPSTPALYDVAQLQTVFGENVEFNPGDTVYTFDIAHQRALFDAGGFDTFDQSISDNNETIDLREGQFSSVLGVNQSLLITYGTAIENANTGAGNDSIRGNEIANVLSGGSGNDLLRGGGDNDQLLGGRGDDTYQWFLGDGRDSIREQGLGGTDVLEFHDASNRLDSLEDDLFFRRLGDDLRIDLRLDQGEGIGTVVIKDFAQAGSEVESLRLFGASGVQIGDDIDLNSVFANVDSFGGRFEATLRPAANGVVAVPVV